jgi:MFS family permease
MSALLGVGGGAGVVLAGPIVDNLSYEYLFWLPLIPIVLATALTYFVVPESPIRVPGRINWTAALLLSGGLVLVLVAVTETPTWHWLSAKTIACLLAGLALLALWVASETRSAHPLVDMRMMRIRGVWTTNAVAFLLGFGMYASFILVPQLVETPTSQGYGFGATVTEAGLFLLPATLAMLVSGSLTGRLERRFGSMPPLLAGAAFGCASFTLLAVAHHAKWQIYVAMLLLGIGIGLAFAAMANLIIENVGPAETGVATGMNAVTRTVGGAFGGAAVASVLAGTVAAGGGFPTNHAYVEAFALCALALFAGVLVGLAIPQRRPEAAFAPHPAGDLATAESEPSRIRA